MVRYAIGLLAALAAAAPAMALAEDGSTAPLGVHDERITLHDKSWLCATPEDYAHALDRVAEGSSSFGTIRKELLDSKKCMLVVEDDIEDMMAPFVEVMERQGQTVRVRFTVEFYKRIELLHRNITRVTFAGWTGEDNLRNYYQWLTGKPQS